MGPRYLGRDAAPGGSAPFMMDVPGKGGKGGMKYAGEYGLVWRELRREKGLGSGRTLGSTWRQALVSLPPAGMGQVETV